MSALGQKQTFATQNAMSALPRIATAKADIRWWIGEANAYTLGRCAMPDKLRRSQRSSPSTDGGAPEIPDLLLKD